LNEDDGHANPGADQGGKTPPEILNGAQSVEVLLVTLGYRFLAIGGTVKTNRNARQEKTPPAASQAGLPGGKNKQLH
jgi:hypothetical protein